MMGGRRGGHQEGMTFGNYDLGLLSSALLALAVGMTGCDGGEGTSDTDGMSGSTSSPSSEGTSGETSTGAETGTASASGTTTGTTTATASSGTGSSGTESSGTDSSGTDSSGSGSSTGDETTGGETTGGDASLPDGFEETLSESGCADMTVWGRNGDDSIALVLSINDDLVADAATAGTTYEGTHAVAEFGTFSVLVGTMVSFPVCNDVATDETIIEQEWVATAGTVDITIEPIEDAPKFGTQGTATLELSGVEVTFDGVTETLDDITFTYVSVGWLPG